MAGFEGGEGRRAAFLTIAGGWRECQTVRQPAVLAHGYYGAMAMRKMTFSVPEPLAAQFLSRVASRDRSRFVSEALVARLAECDAALIRACEIANRDSDVVEIERELDGLRDGLTEPWKCPRELRAIGTPLVRPARVAGLLKGRAHFEPGAFAPMTVEELTEFDGG